MTYRTSWTRQTRRRQFSPNLNELKVCEAHNTNNPVSWWANNWRDVTQRRLDSTSSGDGQSLTDCLSLTLLEGSTVSYQHGGRHSKLPLTLSSLERRVSVPTGKKTTDNQVMTFYANEPLIISRIIMHGNWRHFGRSCNRNEWSWGDQMSLTYLILIKLT